MKRHKLYTSHLDADELAQAVGCPADFVSLHFFGPVPVMRPLDVVGAGETGKDALKTAMALASKLGRVSILSGAREWFVADPMFSRNTGAAIAAVVYGARPAQVDAVLRAFGFSVGPLEVLDRSGLEIGWARRREKGLAERLTPEHLADRRCELWPIRAKTGHRFDRYVPGDRTPRADPDLPRLAEKQAAELGVTQFPSRRPDRDLSRSAGRRGPGDPRRRHGCPRKRYQPGTGQRLRHSSPQGRSDFLARHDLGCHASLNPNGVSA